jgi:hypothetical protein
VALCQRAYSKNTRSQLEKIRSGMPSPLSPFTRWYKASLTLPGYSAATAKVHVVVTGSRFVSDAERLPFPQSRPILALHDPPGGNSFASFHNTRLMMKYTNTDIEYSWYKESAGKAEAQLGNKWEAKLPDFIIAPFGAGQS